MAERETSLAGPEIAYAEAAVGLPVVAVEVCVVGLRLGR